LTLDRAAAASEARVDARDIGREECKADQGPDTTWLAEAHVTAPLLLFG